MNLEVAAKRLFHQQVKIPRYNLLQQKSSQWGLQKLLKRLVSHELTAYLTVFELFLTLWIIVILSKGCKPDNFESHNSLKLSVTDMRGLRSNFIECEFFLELYSPDIFALYETNLDAQLILAICLWGVIFL